MNNKGVFCKGMLVLLALLLCSGSAWSQVGRGIFLGKVTDPQGSAVPGAVITATHLETGASRSAVSDMAGEYRLAGLRIGIYDIVAELAGFSTMRYDAVTLELGQEFPLNVELGLSSIEESITVTGTTTPLVDVRRSEVSANVSELQLDSLPVKTRAWLDIATILPTAHQDAIRARYYNSVNIGSGVIFYTNGFYIDGVNNNWQEQGEPRQDFPADAIAEFKVYTANARAELGWSQGGYMAVVTKSGTNDLHGSTYWYFRDKSLNSQTTYEEGAEKGDFSRNQVGGSIGGPIVKGKTHFFGSVEFTKQEESYTVNTGGVFPSEEGTFPRIGWNRMELARLDHAINDNQHVFARFAEQTNERAFLRSGGKVAESAGHTFGVPRDSLVLGHTWSIGTDMLNEFRFQYSKSTFMGWPSITDFKWTKPGEFPAERINSIPIQISRPSITLGRSGNFLGPEPGWQYRNDFTKYTDKHEIKFGVSTQWFHYQPDTAGDTGRWTFDTDRPYDANDPTTHPIRFDQSFPGAWDIPNQEHSLYIDDTWSITPNLTLNLGVRYDYQTKVWNEDLMTDDLPELRVPVFGIERLIQPKGPPDPTLYPWYNASNRGDSNNIGPRLGAVWNPGGEGKQSVRLAYGIYYQRYRGCPIKRERSPNIPTVRITNPSYPDPYNGLDPMDFAGYSKNIRAEGNDNRNPEASQISIGYTRELGDYTSIDIDLLSTEAKNQHTQMDQNYYANEAARSTKTRPRTDYGQVRTRTTDGKLSYKSVAVKLERRFSNNLQFLISYSAAWAKNDRDGVPTDQFNLANEYGWVVADRRQRLKVSGIYQLPYGMQLSGFMRYVSDKPFDVTAGTDLTGDGVSNRPPGVTYNQGCRGLNLGAVNSYRASKGLSNVGSIDCPDWLTLDLVLLKEFSLSDSTRLELLVQTFNTLNRTNSDLPNNNAKSASFGQSLRAAGEARQIEIALRFKF